MNSKKQFMNRTKAIAALAAMVSTIAIVTTPALANAQTLIRNVDEPGRNPYQQTGSISSCTNGSCAFNFPFVPAGKRLVIQSVSIGFRTTAYPSYKQAVLNTLYDNVVHYLPIEYQGGNSSNGYLFIVNQTVQRYYDAGQQPRLDLFVLGSYQGTQSFTISGYLINLP